MSEQNERQTRVGPRRVSSRGRRLADARGANLVEAALVTPLLLLLTFSIVDFASLFYVYLALESGVSQASRYAVTGQQEPNTSREDSIKLAMRSATPTLTLADDAFAFSHLPPGGGAWLAGAGDPSDIGKVTVTYRWTLMTPLLRAFFDDGQVSLVVESSMKNEPRFD